MDSVRDVTPPTPDFSLDAGADEPLQALAASLADSIEAPGARILAAIHLAGHAVAAEACGLARPDLEVRAPPAAVCSYVPRGGGGGRGPARTAVEAAIIASLAGVEAERLAGGHPNAPCLDVTRWLTDGDPREAEPYVEWLRLKAERTVEHPLRQRVIVAVARALLERGALRAAEIEDIARHETGRYMRGQ